MKIFLTICCCALLAIGMARALIDDAPDFMKFTDKAGDFFFIGLVILGAIIVLIVAGYGLGCFIRSFNS